MSRIVLTVDGATVYDSGAAVPTPTPTPTPTPLPPSTTPENMILRNKSDYPNWVAGNAYNTSGAPLIKIGANEVLAIAFPASLLTKNGTGFFSTYESTPCEVCISDKPFIFETGYMVPYFLDESGKGGIKFLSADNPANNDQFAPYGYKRLPAGDTLYVNLRGKGGEVQTYLLFGS